VAFKVTGQKEITLAFRDVARSVERSMESGPLMEAAMLVVESAKRTTAFKDRTGRLRRSITAFPGLSRSGHATVLVGPAEGAHTAFYGRWIEYGNSRQPSRKFLRPALKENRKRINEILSRAIGKVIKTKMKGKPKRRKKNAAV